MINTLTPHGVEQLRHSAGRHRPGPPAAPLSGLRGTLKGALRASQAIEQARPLTRIALT
jgi:hypothetical protein